jgi:hypothetical protein
MTQTNPIMLYKEVTAVYSENIHKKQKYYVGKRQSALCKIGWYI